MTFALPRLYIRQFSSIIPASLNCVSKFCSIMIADDSTGKLRNMQ